MSGPAAFLILAAAVVCYFAGVGLAAWIERRRQRRAHEAGRYCGCGACGPRPVA